MWYSQKKCDNDISTIFWKSHDNDKTIYRQTISWGLVVTNPLHIVWHYIVLLIISNIVWFSKYHWNIVIAFFFKTIFNHQILVYFSLSCRSSTCLMASCLGFCPRFSSLRSDIGIPSFWNPSLWRYYAYINGIDMVCDCSVFNACIVLVSFFFFKYFFVFSNLIVICPRKIL